MYAFVSVSHPDEIKDRKRQGKLRQHAIRNGIQRSKADRAKKDGVFVPVEIDGKTTVATKRPTNTVALTKAPSVSLMDPFDTLCGCPERLRTLMRHPSAKQVGEPIFCVEDSGKPFFQGMETIFKGALTDPSLFHALSLVLSLAANNNLPNVEILQHRGEILNGIRVNIKGLKGAPQVSTLTAMLLLIGYEYRVDGADCKTISMHIQGVQTMMKLCKERNVALIDEVQRALFWQDLLSCLMAGTPRFLSHRDFSDFKNPIGIDQSQRWQVPKGLQTSMMYWPPECAIVLQDLNALCWVVDSQCNPDQEVLETFPIDNNQANLESRLMDLLRESRNNPAGPDPWYEACILGVYICTYKLSTGIWMGCYIPEICIAQVFQVIAKIPRGAQYEPAPALLQWVLFVCGGMTDRKNIRQQVATLIRERFPDPTQDPEQEWETLRTTLKSFIWCERTMEKRIFIFWNEVYAEATHRGWLHEQHPSR
ncbi:hypothetical protein BKA63DRAFT_324427 [Paraphoma chrysanthemicola]|nr:hypothetical protein BKA63DRAFT_324427 [Paraphoma chrysanthemicola]